MFKKSLFISSLALLLLAGCTASQPGVQSTNSNSSTSTTTSSSKAYNTEAEPASSAADYYIVDGPAALNPAQFKTTSNFEYGEKDSLGRTTTAKATITYADVEKSFDTRGQFARGDNPSGWPKKNPKVTISTSTGDYKGYFWNRSHLIADSLGGEAISQNAITGTRTQNVGNRSNTGGMQYIERKSVQYLKDHKDAKLYYQVTPVYEDNELIPRQVIVDAKTDDGGINERVTVLNSAKGYQINYMDGTISTGNKLPTTN